MAIAFAFVPLWMSLTSILAVYADFSCGGFNPGICCGFSACLTIVLLWVASRRNSYQCSLWVPAIWCAVFFYLFLSSPAPYFVPLSKQWDGANHLALIQELLRHQSHMQILSSGFQLPWGGTLYSYPWGFHAFCAGLSELTGIPPLYLLHAVNSVLVASVAAMVFSVGQQISRTLFFPICALALIMFQKPGMPFLLLGNYWTSISAVCVGFTCLQFASSTTTSYEKMARHQLVLLTILWAGLFLIYPLFVFPFSGAHLIYCAMHRRKDLLRMTAILVCSLAIALPYVLLTFQDNVARLGRDGMRIWYGLDEFPSEPFGLSLTVAGIVVALGRIKRDEFLNALTLACASGWLLCVAFSIPGYWQDKFFAITFLFATSTLMIGLAQVFASDTRGIAWWGSRTGVAFFVLLSPRVYPYYFGPALSASKLDTLKWLSKQERTKKVAVVSDLYTVMWFYAANPEQQFIAPLRDKRRAYKIAKDELLLPYYLTRLAAGDFLVLDTVRSNIPETCNQLAFQRGAIRVFECNS